MLGSSNLGNLVVDPDKAIELMESTRAQGTLLDAVDGGAPSEEWAILSAMHLMALSFLMVPEYRVAALKMSEQFCSLVGVDAQAMEAYVFKTVTAEEAD